MEAKCLGANPKRQELELKSLPLIFGALGTREVFEQGHLAQPLTLVLGHCLSLLPCCAVLVAESA